MTNLEKIKGFDGYDMATFLDELSKKGSCEYCVWDSYGKCISPGCECASGYYKWLLKESDGDVGDSY